MERHHLGVTRNALRENRLVIFGLCSIGLRRHGPFISCHIFLPLCFALSGTLVFFVFFGLFGFFGFLLLMYIYIMFINISGVYKHSSFEFTAVV